MSHWNGSKMAWKQSGGRHARISLSHRHRRERLVKNTPPATRSPHAAHRALHQHTTSSQQSFAPHLIPKQGGEVRCEVVVDLHHAHRPAGHVHVPHAQSHVISSHQVAACHARAIEVRTCTRRYWGARNGRRAHSTPSQNKSISTCTHAPTVCAELGIEHRGGDIGEVVIPARGLAAHIERDCRLSIQQRALPEVPWERERWPHELSVWEPSSSRKNIQIKKTANITSTAVFRSKERGGG